MIPTIERRFNLRSINSGMVSGGYDIASLLCLIPVTYFGGRPNACKPIWIGAGIIVMGIGSLIFASPHFLSNPPYVENKDVNSNLCDSRRNGMQQVQIFNMSIENKYCNISFQTSVTIDETLYCYRSVQTMKGLNCRHTCGYFCWVTCCMELVLAPFTL